MANDSRARADDSQRSRRLKRMEATLVFGICAGNAGERLLLVGSFKGQYPLCEPCTLHLEGAHNGSQVLPRVWEPSKHTREDLSQVRRKEADQTRFHCLSSCRPFPAPPASRIS